MTRSAARYSARPLIANASPLSRVETRVVAAVFVCWALGFLASEALQQLAAGASVLLAVAWWRRLTLAPDVRAYVFSSVALVGWQVLSPALALATGTAVGWPRLTRYGQVLDSAAGPAAAALGSMGVPWVVLGVLLSSGWLVAAALGLYQHFVQWPFEPPSFLRLTVSRVHENFGTPEAPRYAAGGLYFHRLRFAHSAIAMLGPALATAIRGTCTRRLVSGAVSLMLLVSIYASFARAALGAALVVCLLSLVLLWGGRARALGVAVVGVWLVGVLASPAWGDRFARGAANLFGGEREVAMRQGLKVALEHPLLGVGFGNHKHAALAAPQPEGMTDLLANDAHNLWLTTWAETGLVGLLLLLATHALLARALLRRFGSGSLAAAGALLSWLGFHVLSLVHYLPFHSSVHLSFALVWGLGLCGSAEPAARDPQSARS